MINSSEPIQATLIDFGYVTNYVDKDNNHLKMHMIDTFSGNLMFASLDQLNYIRPSRRSDLHSLCYIFIFILNGLEMPLLEVSGD